jgi:hypothetical protein
MRFGLDDVLTDLINRYTDYSSIIFERGPWIETASGKKVKLSPSEVRRRLFSPIGYLSTYRRDIRLIGTGFFPRLSSFPTELASDYILFRYNLKYRSLSDMEWWQVYMIACDLGEFKVARYCIDNNKNTSGIVELFPINVGERRLILSYIMKQFSGTEFMVNEFFTQCCNLRNTIIPQRRVIGNIITKYRDTISLTAGILPAIQSDNMSILELLLDSGFDKWEYAIGTADRLRKTEIKSYLIERGRRAYEAKIEIDPMLRFYRDTNIRLGLPVSYPLYLRHSI